MSRSRWPKLLEQIGFAAESRKTFNRRRKAELRRRRDTRRPARLESLEGRLLLTGFTDLDDLNLVDSDVTVVEIGGVVPGPGSPNVDAGHDQINVSNSAVLDGLLRVELINDFTPSVGDEFDIITFGTTSGAFDSADGLFGFANGSLYFEIALKSDRLTLITHELTGGSFLVNSDVAANGLGQLLNASYFPSLDPSLDATASISGTYRVGDFLEARGTFLFAADLDESVTLANGTTKDVTGISVGAANVDAFAGIGPYFVDSNQDGTIDGDDTPSSDAVGVALTNLDFGLVMLVGSDLSSPPDPTTDPEAAVNYAARYLALKATADSAALVGTGDTIVAELRDLSVDVNLAKSPIENPLYSASVIDFTQLAGSSLPVSTGDTANPTVLVDASEEIIAASAGQVTLGISDFVQIRGSGLAIEKGPARTVTLANGATKEVTVLTLGASGFDAFAGIGPYFVDSDNDGDIDTSDTPSADAVGLKITNLSFGLALMAGADITDVPDVDTNPDGFVNHLATYVASTGSAERAEIIGTGDALTAEILGLSLELNQARSRVSVPGHDPSAINFSTLPNGGYPYPRAIPKTRIC